MTEHSRRQLERSVSFVALGVVVLILGTGLAAGVTASIDANRQLGQLTHDLADARSQRDTLSLQIEQLIRVDASLQGQVAHLRKQNDDQKRQNRALQVEIKALIAFLHSKGLQAPDVTTSSSSGNGSSSSVTRPKVQPPAPSQPRPTSPSPTARPTSSPSPSPINPLDPLCNLAPILCQ